MTQGSRDIEFAEAGICSSLAEAFAKAMESKARPNLLCFDEFTLQLIEDAIKAVAGVGPALLVHRVLGARDCRGADL